ncbi:hypothetical protein F5Y18DRAFT_67853 [Xylariaceae sp. FL1019]|nr:hypothetical protein F5Y18DRAFT_67853 [Xylariaceae sp. FL1019]
MSGVRNLRAMFEQKGDSGPPDDRGRSPGPAGFVSPSPSASPRPLSKVRTTFVAVEKDGRIGLKREPSRDSASVSSRRLSDETSTTTPQPVSERTDIFADNMATNASAFKTNLAHQAIPESPKQDTPAKFSPSKLSPKKEFKSPTLVPNANPDKFTDEEEPHTKMLTSDPTSSSASRVGGTILDGGISDALNGTPKKAMAETAPKATKLAPKTAPVSTAKTASKAPKSPMATKAPAPTVKEPVRGSSTAASNGNGKKTTTTKTLKSKPSAINLSQTNNGFVKPKPKSPTRPVKLPSSLMAPTASSSQKVGSGSSAPPARALSRASGNVQHLSVNSAAHRSPSRSSVSTTATNTKSLRHKASNANVGRPSRPSLGPPPKPTSKETKKEGQVDDSFLARMMRPTASSASKTSEKAPVTPPRKAATTKKTDIKEVEGNAKKVAAKIQASSTKATTAKDAVKALAKEQPTAKEIAPAVAQVETAEAAIEEAKLSLETAEAPLVEETPVEAEPTAQDIAVVVAQEDTAEAIVETAKTSAVTADVSEPEVGDAAENVIETHTSLQEQDAVMEDESPSVEKVDGLASTPELIEQPLSSGEAELGVAETIKPTEQAAELSDEAVQDNSPEMDADKSAQAPPMSPDARLERPAADGPADEDAAIPAISSGL